ncbi:uncharacterized protein LOC141714560 [Apium graveolens]|uniref:uncharacterized protein LOC141714560 n=1 Tax=Apium graveolens TaxID=4045 RepID=UPI003D7B563C
MNFAVWNVRGINKAPHQKELQNFISSNNVNLMGVLETKVKSDNALGVSKKICRDWKWLFNYNHHYNGRVWVGWNPSVWDISIHSMSSQVITCNATFLEKNITILVSFVYAFNDAVDRVPLWNYCLSLSTTTAPWYLLGDFNCVTSLGEVSGGREHWTPEMQSFTDCLANCGLDTVRTVGNIHTWTNKRLASPIFKRLDRMVANGVWFNSFTKGNVFVKPRGIMDHNALLLKETKRLLRQLNKDHGNVSSNVLNARANLEEVQLRMINNTDTALLNLEKDLINKLNATLVEEESFFLQKSRVKWMELGDGNNSFFHQQCKANWNCNKVLALEDNLGNMVITEAQATSLCAMVTDVIIYATLKKMKKNKAPRPDGFNVEFFLATWSITGVDFCDSVKHFFETGFLPSSTNSTFISLIPKVASPTVMNDFRPISLCTVMYKCISKIIAARLKLIMPSIIDIA